MLCYAEKVEEDSGGCAALLLPEGYCVAKLYLLNSNDGYFRVKAICMQQLYDVVVLR